MKNMIRMSLQTLTVSIIFFFFSVHVYAASCVDVFPSVISSSLNSGTVKLESDSILSGTDGSIDIGVTEDYHSINSCVSQTCVDSTHRSEPLSLTSFQQSISSDNHTANNGTTLSLQQGSYNQITLNYQATVHFTQNNQVTYIKNLNANQTDTTVIFEEGVYWIDNFDVGYRTDIVINGNDKVTLFVNTSNFNQAEITFNANGTHDQLSLITYSHTHFGYKSLFNGFIYADSTLIIQDESRFDGAISGNNITLKYRAKANYAADSVETLSVDQLCTSSDASETLLYPYETDFEGTNVEWEVDNDWAINSSGHSAWQARSGTTFLDNNPNEIDQELHRNHYATLIKPVYIPFDSVNPTLSYYYKAGIYSGQLYSQISTNGIDWIGLETYQDRDNHSDYTRRDVSLESYKGQNVQIRFRQYYNTGIGPRLFVIDDFRIGDLQADEYNYPYSNGFETDELREHFNYEGDWNSSVTHDTEWFPSTGSYFLDNNYNNEDQYLHLNQYATMNGFITIPLTAKAPMISFDYMLNSFDGWAYLMVQEYGSTEWTSLKVFYPTDRHTPYTKYEHDLTTYVGKKVRFRFRQYWRYETGPRVFTVDNIFIGELTDLLPFPYSNNFETTEEQAQWHAQGEWAISTAHDTKWFPSSGSYFLDNNADNADQAEKRNYYATMSGYVPLPEDASDVVVTFDYLLDIFDGQNYLQIQKQGDSTWTSLKVYFSEFNRSKYTNEEISLADYAGENVRFRFRQYYYSEVGPRVFTVDNFKIERVTIEDFPYPYFNDFETAISTVTINGQDHWANIGDWDISEAHDAIYTPESGAFFLDNNVNNVDQEAQYHHYATMRGYVALPDLPANPMISFNYKLDIFGGLVYLQIQEEGSNVWTNLEYFRDTDNHDVYTKYEYFLGNYVGKKVRFRFRQYWYATEEGARQFSVDNLFIGELTDTLSYPYDNTFETAEEQNEWQNEGDWGVSTAHDEKWYPKTGSYFLDGNTGNKDQALHREHFATLSGYIQLPEDTSNVVVSFDYLLQTFDGQPYIYIQKLGDSTWTHLVSYTSVNNHATYANEEISLEAYAGEQVRFRFRQYYYLEEGPRVFAVDNFHVGEPLAPDFEYPYFNDFETLISTPLINGQDHWNNKGDWGISKAHDNVYTPRKGEYFLDNNPDVEDQGAHYNHYTNLIGYVPIPEDSASPQLSFWYKADIFNGWTFLQIQEKGSNTWTNIFSFSDSYNHSTYTKFYYDLSAYKGKSVRVRFRQYWSDAGSGPRVFSVDDFKIGEDDEENLSYPYVNTFETAEEREQFQTQGDWGISTAHDTDYVPYEGNWFMDNNADFEDQYLHLQHYTTLSSYIAIPADANVPTLSFKYKANSFDAGVYLEIKRKDQNNWTNLQSFTESLNHDEYVTFEAYLDEYKGEEVQFRFRQYWRYETGPRLFVIDNFRVGDFIQKDFTFPYYNDFDTEVSTASKNGRDHWNTEGDWGISNQNDVAGVADSGEWFLDNNPAAEDQSVHYNHYAAMTGFVKIPLTAVNPKVSFDYTLDIPSGSGYAYIYMQKAGSSTWIHLKTFQTSDNTEIYTNYSRSLSAYKGESVRFRFRQYNYVPEGSRRFDIDNFSIDQELLGIWYFEENWEDATGHGFDLEPKNTPTFNDVIPRARDGIAGSDTSTCFYTGYTDGQYAVATNTDTQNVFNELTASVWVKPSAYNNSMHTIISKGDGFSIFLDAVGRIQWQYLDTQLSTSSVVPIDEWTHITVTFKDGEQHIYINGASVASASIVGILSDLDEDFHVAAALDPNTNLPIVDQYFEGSVDELRVYRIVQDATAIADDMNVLHPCEISVTPDHYRIEHDGAGLTCEAETFTIKACNDVACTVLNEEPTTVDFHIDGVFANTYTFTGSTTINGQMAAFNQLTPKTVALSIVNPVIPAINSAQCFNGSENTCAIEFKDAGFKFTYGTSNTENIDLQTAGVNFSAPLKIQAVSSDSGACSALFNNETVNIGLAQENIVPTNTSSGQSFFVNGVELNKFNNQNPQYENVKLTFDSSGFAEVPSVYNDAGEIKLHALYNQNSINAYGGSKTFWVKPNALQMLAKKIDENGTTGETLNGNTSNSTTKHAAGVPFEFVLTALNAAGDVTKNYVPQGLILSTQRVGPITEGVDGILATDTHLNTFDNGISISNMNYSEVGLINIDIEDVNYGNTGINVPSASDITVGRFIPDHFTVSVKSDGEFQNACVAGTSEFTYTGQKFSYKSAFLPQFIIEAKNAQGIITQNYTIDGYNKLNESGVFRTFNNSDTTQVGNDLLTLTTTSVNSATGQLTATLNNLGEPLHGSQTYTFNANDMFTYDKNTNAKIAQYTSAYQVFITKIEDQDNVSDSTGNAPIDMLPIAISPTGVNLRYGRLTMENTFGPETSNLPIILKAEYWNGDEFVINTLDGCTLYEHNNLKMNPAGFTTVIGEGAFYQGSTDQLENGLELIAPVTSTGKVELEYDLDEIKWLQYDWDGDPSNIDTNPIASAMFGRFRNNDRVIYWREVF